MVTRAHVGIVKPTQVLNLHTSYVSPIPNSLFLALHDPHWRNTKVDEHNALIKNGTWVLVHRPPDVNIVRPMWLFRHKNDAYGALSQ